MTGQMFEITIAYISFSKLLLNFLVVLSDKVLKYILYT